MFESYNLSGKVSYKPVPTRFMYHVCYIGFSINDIVFEDISEIFEKVYR